MVRYSSEGTYEINRKRMKIELEQKLELGISESIILAEVVFTPVHSCQGRNIYIQLRKSGKCMFLCYATKPWGSDELSCGVKTTDKAFFHRMNLLLAEMEEVNEISPAEDKAGCRLEIYLADKHFFWNDGSCPEEYKLPEEIIKRLLALLPAEYHTI